MQKGILFQSISLVAPIADRIRKTRFRSLSDRLILSSIRGYQQYLSPHKGFSCAYRKLHGGVSCSEYFRQSIDRYGLSPAIPLFQKRLEACKLAKLTLRSRVSGSEERRRRHDRHSSCHGSDCANWSGCGDCSTLELLDCDGCDRNFNGTLDCGDCNTPDCGDCTISDCGSCDCSF